MRFASIAALGSQGVHGVRVGREASQVDSVALQQSCACQNEAPIRRIRDELHLAPLDAGLRNVGVYEHQLAITELKFAA